MSPEVYRAHLRFIAAISEDFTPRYPDLSHGCRPLWQARLRTLGGWLLDGLTALLVLFVVWSFITVLLLGA
jgi:hypothetical protein